MTDASQGASTERLNLSLSSAPFITTLPSKQFIATINGRDGDGEDRVARFSAPKNVDQDGVQKILDDAFAKGSIDLEGKWETRRFRVEGQARSAVEFVVSNLEPGPAKAVGEVEKPAEAAAPKRPAGKAIAVLAGPEEVKAALDIIKGGQIERASSVTEALVLYKEALEQPIYEPLGNDKFKATGRYANGAGALEMIDADFGGASRHRNIYISSEKAEAILDKLAPDHADTQRKILEDALEQTRERRAQARESKAAPATEPVSNAKAPEGAKAVEPAVAKEPSAPAKPPKEALSDKSEAKVADPARSSSVAHQADPMLLTASLPEIKAAIAGKQQLNSPVATMLKTFATAVSQPEWAKRADGKGNEKTGVVHQGADGLKHVAANFGTEGFRNVYIDKGRATDVLMALDDGGKTNATMAAALEKSRERRLQMKAEKTAAKPKVKVRERDRD